MRKRLILVAALAFSTCAFSDTVTWVATGNDQFGTVDLNTGSYSQIANLGFIPAGLGEIGNTVYTAEFNSTALDKINTTTGAITTVGSGSQAIYTLGSTMTGLYMIDNQGVLWNINASTGASTSIGSTLLNVGDNFTGMSTGSGTLYFALGDSIYSINTTNAHATFVGSTSPNFYGALVDVQDSIYSASITNPPNTYVFDPTTGNNTMLATTSLPDYAYGLAPMVPEPASFGLLGLAGVLLGGYALKRKRA